MTADAWIGADAGAILNINGGIQFRRTPTTTSVYFTGAGTTNLNSSLPKQLY